MLSKESFQKQQPPSLGSFGAEDSCPLSAGLFSECTKVDCCDEEGSLCFLARVDCAFSSFSAFDTRLPGESAEVGIVIHAWLPGEDVKVGIGACENVGAKVGADAQPEGSCPVGGANDCSVNAVLR